MNERGLSMSLKVDRIGNGDFDSVAALHAVCFEEAWQPHLMRRIMSGSGAFGLLTRRDGHVVGFVLCRSGGGEGEILSLAVEPELRRQGVGRALLEAAIKEAGTLGIESLFLEVAEDNEAARRLYEGFDFSNVGRRRGYYRRRLGPSVDALTLRRQLVEHKQQGNEF